MSEPIRCRLFLAESPAALATLESYLHRRGAITNTCAERHFVTAVQTSTGRQEALVELLVPAFDVPFFFRRFQERLPHLPVTALILFDTVPAILFARLGHAAHADTEAAFGEVLQMLEGCGALPPSGPLPPRAYAVTVPTALG